LKLLAERRTNAEIAAALFLSQKTVRNCVSGILAKLEVADRAEARLVARASGTRPTFRLNLSHWEDS
jgi:DNA-binding NarL/FixJ family response regulator